MGNTYDAIVVRGGHNGLVAAAYAHCRTPVDCLGNASSSATHGEGCVCGIPGMQAARAALADARVARRSPWRLIGRAGR